MNLIIRKATLLDARDVTILHIRSWIAAYSGIIPSETIAEINGGRLAKWHNFISQNNGAYFIAFCNHELAGLIAMSAPRDEDIGEDSYEIIAFYLSPEYFGKGIGRQMMDFALSYIKSLGCRTAILWALEENVRADKFYKKCGFYPDGTKKEVIIGKPLIEIRYRKEL